MVAIMEKGKQTRRPHVLVFPYPTQGHINPMLQFAKCLTRELLSVTFVTSTFVTQSLRNTSSAKPLLLQSIRFETISDGFDNGRSRKDSIAFYLEKFKITGQVALTELIARLVAEGYPVNCIVYDPLLPWIADVSENLEIPSAAFFTQSCAVFALYFRYHEGSLSICDEKAETMEVPGLPMLGLQDIPSFLAPSNPYPAHLDLLLSQFSNLDKAQYLFVNSFYELEEEAIVSLMGRWPIKTIGPMVPSAFTDTMDPSDRSFGLSLWEEEECLVWLDTKPIGSVVYVSFGSLVGLDETTMSEIAWGLLQNQKPFLWVVRPPGVPQGYMGNELPVGFVDEVKGRGLVVEWCPQLEVLSHQSVGCFVTHCGWNSTLEGLSLGVPLVAIPQWTDQLTNAKYVEDVWRVGLRARVNDMGFVSRGELERCIREIMDGDRGVEIKKNAAKWKILAMMAREISGTSHRNIEDFVGELLHT